MYTHKEGVTLRKIEPSDLHYLLDLKKDTWWGTHGMLVANIQDQIEWYKSIPSNALYLIAAYDHRTVGVASITDIDWMSGVMDISGIAHKNARGKKCKDGNLMLSEAGFMAGIDFCFEVLNAHRLNAEVLETNYASLSLQLDSIGFSYEGRKRKSTYKCGRYYDSIVIGLLREDWERQQRVISYGGCCNTNLDFVAMQKNAVKSSQRCPPV